jgi:predicted glycosyltransferase involved in capsule biosynthesis
MKFSYIIGFRKKDEKRFENLICVLDWLFKNKDETFEVIVVEQDSEKKCDLKRYDCNHLFIHNDKSFNRGWGFNVGALNTNSDIFVFADCDIFLKWNCLLNAIQHCDTYWDAIDPKGIIYDLIYQNYDLEKSLQNGEFSIRSRVNFSGGICVIRKGAFFKINGWDEEFIGWGCEDDCMSHKIGKMLDKSKRIKFPIFHLYHEKIKKNEEEYNNNVLILKQIVKMNEKQLFEYYKNKKIGKKDKYTNNYS